MGFALVIKGRADVGKEMTGRLAGAAGCEGWRGAGAVDGLRAFVVGMVAGMRVDGNGDGDGVLFIINSSGIIVSVGMVACG